MNRLRILALLALAGALAAPTGLAADDAPELRILKARFDFGPKPGTDRLTLRAAFDPSRLTDGRTPGNAPLLVTIGPETIISLPPLEERMRLKASKNGYVWRLRVRKTREQRDSAKLKLHLGKGWLKLTAERLDFGEIRGRGAEEVSFSLTVSGATLTETLEMGVKDDRWQYRYTGKGQSVAGGNPGGGWHPDPPEPVDAGPPPGPVSFRLLDLRGYGNTYGPRTAVCRTEQEFATEWAKYATPPYGGSAIPLPTVDFTKEIVVFIDYGMFSGGTWAEVKTVKEVGNGLEVEWWAWSSGNCPTPGVPSSLFAVAAVTRRDGPVTFVQKSMAQQCP